MSSLLINRSSIIVEQGLDQHGLPTLFEGSCNSTQSTQQEINNIRSESNAKNDIKMIENIETIENNNNGVVIRRSITGNKHSKWRSGIPCTHIGLDNTIVTQYTSILSISQDNLSKIFNSFNNNDINLIDNDEVLNNDVKKLKDANGNNDIALVIDQPYNNEKNVLNNPQSIIPCIPASHVQTVKSFPGFPSNMEQTTNFPSTDASNVVTSSKVEDENSTKTHSKCSKSHPSVATSSISNSFSTPKKLKGSFDDEHSKDDVICHDIKSSAFKREFYRSINGRNNKGNDGNNSHNSASNARASYISNSSRSSSSSNRKLRPLSSMSNNKRESNDSIISRLDECAHFHYETVEFDFFELSLVEDNFDDETSEKWLSVKVATKNNSWKITKTYISVHCMDEQLHSCIFTRKFSLLPQLTACLLEDQGPVRARSKICTYFDRLAILPICNVNCSRILSWMEMDNKGRRVAINNDINVPAIAAGHTVRNYVAQSNEELSINVGDILSIIDKPPMSESCWWKGKKDLEVGFFPSECVELFESGNLPTSLAIKCPYNKNSSLGKKNKLKVLLSTFFNNRPNRSSLKRTGIVKERLFGCDLGEHLLNSGEDVPNILKTCAQVLETQGVIDGIYRLSGAASTINKLRNEFDAGKIPPLCPPHLYNQDIHSISSLLKMYFRELPNPLLTYQLYDQFISAIMEKNEQQRHMKVCDVVKQLPPPHFRTACYLFQHLHRMQQHHHITNMHCKNLAIVWAPNLIRSKELEQLKCNDAALKVVGIQAVVSEFLIRNVHTIFIEENYSVDDGTMSWRDETTKSRLGSCSQAVSSPKLLSLEEAQERHSLSSIKRNRSGDEGVRFALSEVVPARAEYKYLRYHTVIELPKDKKRLKEKLPSPSRLRSFFRRSQSSSFKTDIKNDKSLSLKDKQKIQASSMRLGKHNKNLSTSVLLSNNNSVAEDIKRLSSSCDLSPSILQAMSRQHSISGKKTATRSLPFFENNEIYNEHKSLKSSSLESKNKKLKKSAKKDKKVKKEAYNEDEKTSKNNKLTMKLFSSMRQQNNSKNNGFFASQRRKCGSGSESNDFVDKQLRLATLITNDNTTHNIHNTSCSYSYTTNNKSLFTESNDNSFFDFNNEIDLSFASDTADNLINKKKTLISNSDVDSPSKNRWKKKKKSIVKFRTSSFSSGNDNDEEEEEEEDYNANNKEYKQFTKGIINNEKNTSTAVSDNQARNTYDVKINDDIDEVELDKPVLIDEDVNATLNASFHESVIKNGTDKAINDFVENISNSLNTGAQKSSTKHINDLIQPSAKDKNTQSNTNCKNIMATTTNNIPQTEALVINPGKLKSPNILTKHTVERQKSADLLNWQIVKNIDCNLYKELSPEWNALFNKTFPTENNSIVHQANDANIHQDVNAVTNLKNYINNEVTNADSINTSTNNRTVNRDKILHENKLNESCNNGASDSQNQSPPHNNQHSNTIKPNNVSLLDKALDILEQVSTDKIDDETNNIVKPRNLPVPVSLFNTNHLENINDNQNSNNRLFKVLDDKNSLLFSTDSKDACKNMRDKYLKRNSIHLCLEEPKDPEQKQKRLLTPQHEHLECVFSQQQEVLSDAALDLFSFDRMYSHETSSIPATPLSSHPPFQAFSSFASSAPQPPSPLDAFSTHSQSRSSHSIQPQFSLASSSNAPCMPPLLLSHDSPATPDLVVCNDESLIRRLVSLTSPLKDTKNRATVMLPVGGAALQQHGDSGDEGRDTIHLKNNQHNDDEGNLFTDLKRHLNEMNSLNTSNQFIKNRDIKSISENQTKEKFCEQLKLSEQQKNAKSHEQRHTKKNIGTPSTQNSKEIQNSLTKPVEYVCPSKANFLDSTSENKQVCKDNKPSLIPPSTEPLKRKEGSEFVQFDNNTTNKKKFFNQYIESLERKDSSSHSNDIHSKFSTKNLHSHVSPHITQNLKQFMCSNTVKQAEQQSKLFQRHLDTYKEHVALPSLSHPWLDSFGNSSVRLTSKELREWQEKYLQEQQSKQNKPQRKISKLKSKDKQLKSKLQEKTADEDKKEPAGCPITSENVAVNEKCVLGNVDKIKNNIVNKSSSNQTTQHHSNRAVFTTENNQQVTMQQNTTVQSQNLQEFYKKVSSQSIDSKNAEGPRQNTNKVSEKRQLFDKH